MVSVSNWIAVKLLSLFRFGSPFQDNGRLYSANTNTFYKLYIFHNKMSVFIEVEYPEFQTNLYISYPSGWAVNRLIRFFLQTFYF